MKLFLASEAKHPESMEKFKKFVGRPFEGLRLTCIPTAANGEMPGSWKMGESFKIAKSLGAKFNIIELEECVFRDVVEEIKGSDIIWVAGGMSGYLLYWMRRSKLDKFLPEFFSQRGIYIGSSAGSMACSATQHVGGWFIGEEEPGAELIPGLGLVDFEIYPHYQDELKPQIEKLWEKGTLYLLKNGEAITVEDGRVEVLGEERIIRK